MSYSLRVVGGDLCRRGSQLDIVYGLDKLLQDIDLWLRERYGGDRFHLNMGSILQDFIGGVVSDSTNAEVQAEVLRVLQNYQAVQLRRLREKPQSLSPSEMLVSIDDVSTRTNYDSVQVAVRLRNGSNVSSAVKVGVGL